MNAEAWTIVAVGVALGGLIVALGGLMWQMLRSFRLDVMRQFGEVDKKFNDIGKKFEEVAENFRDVRNRLDRLAADHHGLARELSELRGELRGRLDERARPAPG